MTTPIIQLHGLRYRASVALTQPSIEVALAVAVEALNTGAFKPTGISADGVRIIDDQEILTAWTGRNTNTKEVA